VIIPAIEAAKNSCNVGCNLIQHGVILLGIATDVVAADASTGVIFMVRLLATAALLLAAPAAAMVQLNLRPAAGPPAAAPAAFARAADKPALAITQSGSDALEWGPPLAALAGALVVAVSLGRRRNYLPEVVS
jgi:hypothetical protein